MRLALAFGRTASELEETMLASEWREWQAFMGEEPVGEARADWRSAILASILANAHRGRATSPFKPADFVLMPEFRPQPREESVLDIARAWGASVP